MKDTYDATEWAANMLCGRHDANGLLHTDLYDTLNRYERLCGRDQISLSGVAAVVIAWELANPDEPAICDG